MIGSYTARHKHLLMLGAGRQIVGQYLATIDPQRNKYVSASQLPAKWCENRSIWAQHYLAGR